MENKKYCVYKHIFPNNKVYIGVTCQKPEYRWRNGKGYHMMWLEDYKKLKGGITWKKN